MDTGSPRIKGTGLSMRLGDPPRDYWADAISVVMAFEVAQEELFDQYERDIYIKDKFFDVVAIQSTEPDSLWSLLFEHWGKTVPFAYAPHGNETPSPSQPHFTGLLQLPGPPALGGEAGEHNEYVFETRLRIVQGPLRVTE